MDDVNRVFPDQSPSKNPILLRDLEHRANEVGRMLKDIMPEGVGFAFLMFTFDGGDSGWMTYASNAQRSDMIKALQEMIEKLEGSP